MPWVEMQGFSYTYPGEDKPALREIDLGIQKHDFVVIAGRSGSGKSTLGKALAGFLFQDEQPNYTGNIIINGTDMAKIPLYKASERVAYVQQNPEDQFCTLTVLDEISFALENACLPPDLIEQRIDQALSVVKGIDLKDRLLATLSGGEKQKIAIASMLALGPDVLILDEPTSNLDPNATQHVFETLHALRAEKDLTVIIIEHKLTQLLGFNPKFVYIDEGQIVSENPLIAHKPVRITPVGQAQSSNRSSPTLMITDLHVRLNGHTILQDINLNLYQGEFAAVMGPNGSGKSTLLRIIMGFHKPEQGALNGFGQDLTRVKTSALVHQIGFIFQNPDHQLFTHSVWDEAILTLKNLDRLSEQSKQKAQELLSQIGLKDRLADHPQRLSYGEKRRLNLVAVILHNPKLLLIDEFLIGQDLPNAHKLMQMLKNYTANGVTVLLVNHHADLTQAYCDRLIFLDGGMKILDEPINNAFIKLAQLGFSAFLPQQQADAKHA
jgi:energy-coupling factor transport system ATP-binding protein